MTETERAAKLAELERLLNDPATPLDAERVWALLAEIGGRAPA
jgi:hypothetical protein